MPASRAVRLDVSNDLFGETPEDQRAASVVRAGIGGIEQRRDDGSRDVRRHRSEAGARRASVLKKDGTNSETGYNARAQA